MKKPKKQQWIFAVASALPFHLAFAGIPVVDGVNLSQTTVSAIQNVAAVTKQIEQYKTQLQQYQIMLRNSAAPADYIWSQDRVPGSGVTEPAEGALRAKEDGHRGSWLTLSLRT